MLLERWFLKENNQTHCIVEAKIIQRRLVHHSEPQSMYEVVARHSLIVGYPLDRESVPLCQNIDRSDEDAEWYYNYSKEDMVTLFGLCMRW